MNTASIKYMVMILVAAEISFAQDTNSNNKTKFPPSEIDLKTSQLTKDKIDITINEEKVNTGNFNGARVEFYKETKSINHSFNIMSSVGSNISFGGFWEKYAIINLTPQLDIKPLAFIRIYANHNFNCFIPLREMKEYLNSIALQSITMLAVENSLKIILNSDDWIGQVISFAAKNILLNFVLKPSMKKDGITTPALEYENFYYSMSFTF